MMIGQINNNYENRFQTNRPPGGPGGPQGPQGPQGPPRRPGNEEVQQGGGTSANSVGARMRADRAQGQGASNTLTAEQQAEVQSLRQEAQADGTVTGEERRAIGDALKSYRDEASSTSSSSSSSSNSSSSSGGPFDAGGPFADLDLSDSQRSQIESLAAAAKSDGQFTHEERESIHQTVESMVGHSIPRPQGPPGGGQPQEGASSSQFGGSVGNVQQSQYGNSFSGAQQFQTSMSQLQQVFQGFLGSY